MDSYNVNLKNGDYFTVEVEEGAPAPILTGDGLGVLVVENLPAGYSVAPREVLYIEPSDD